MKLFKIASSFVHKYADEFDTSDPKQFYELKQETTNSPYELPNEEKDSFIISESQYLTISYILSKTYEFFSNHIVKNSPHVEQNKTIIKVLNDLKRMHSTISFGEEINDDDYIIHTSKDRIAKIIHFLQYWRDNIADPEIYRDAKYIDVVNNVIDQLGS